MIGGKTAGVRKFTKHALSLYTCPSRLFPFSLSKLHRHFREIKQLWTGEKKSYLLSYCCIQVSKRGGERVKRELKLILGMRERILQVATLAGALLSELARSLAADPSRNKSMLDLNCLAKQQEQQQQPTNGRSSKLIRIDCRHMRQAANSLSCSNAAGLLALKFTKTIRRANQSISLSLPYNVSLDNPNIGSVLKTVAARKHANS